MNKILAIVIFTIIGLLIGYLLFGKMGGEYLDISTIFGSSGGGLGDFARDLSGITKARNNIMITGGVGFVIGLIFTFIKKK